MLRGVLWIVLMIAACYSPLVFGDKSVIYYGQEDGLFENLTAACFFLASAAFFIAYVRDRTGGAWGVIRFRRNVFLVLLALMFAFGASEEISWGQRIIGFKTPEQFSQLNTQHETNIHNLKIFNRAAAPGDKEEGPQIFLNFDRLFSAFWMSFCFFFPAVRRTSARVKGWADRSGVPDVPLWIGVFFPVNYIVCKAAQLLTLGSPEVWRGLTEIKECVVAILFFIVSLHILRSIHPSGRQRT